MARLRRLELAVFIAGILVLAVVCAKEKPVMPGEWLFIGMYGAFIGSFIYREIRNGKR